MAPRRPKGKQPIRESSIKPVTRKATSSIGTGDSAIPSSVGPSSSSITFGDIVVPMGDTDANNDAGNIDAAGATDAGAIEANATRVIDNLSDDAGSSNVTNIDETENVVADEDITMSSSDGDSISGSSPLTSEVDEEMEGVHSSEVHSSSLGNNRNNQRVIDGNITGEANYTSDKIGLGTSIDSISSDIDACCSVIANLTRKLVLVNRVGNESEAIGIRAKLAQESHDLQQLNLVLQTMEKRKKDLWDSNYSNKVPKNLPRIQWKGNVFDTSCEVFRDARDALSKYRAVMSMHGMRPDKHWKRLLPAVLSQDQINRLSGMPSTVESYAGFHRFFLDTFCMDHEEEKVEAVNDLMEISMGNNESLDKYIDRFYALKKKASGINGSLLAGRFINGLPEKLQDYLNIATIGWSSHQKRSLTFTISAAKKVHSKIGHKSSKPVVKDSSGSNGINKWQEFSRNSGESSSSDGSSRIPESSRSGGYSRSNQGNRGGSYEDKKKHRMMLRKKGLCFKCEQTYGRDHVCNDAHNNGDKKGNLTFKSMNRKVSKLNNKVDDLLLESNLPLLNSEQSDFVPLTVNGLQVFGFIDNGANFSSIHPRILKYFNKDNILHNNNGTVSLAHSNAAEIDRIGQVKDVDVLYNGINLKFDFEIFDFDSDAAVCIGRDLMPKLNICLTGLATSWVHYEPAKEEPIDASVLLKDNETKNFDFGSKEEREQMMYELQPLLEENERIPINSCCTLPGAEVELHIDESKYKYRRQYPIPYGHKQPVDDQVQTWLKDGVIAEANDKDAKCYQSPLLVVRKKDLNGEYGKKVRVVLDIRSVNEVLIPSTICKFQLPLISDLHQRMSGKKLFSVLDLTQCYHRFPMHPDSQKYVVFYHEGKQYKFKRAPFGISSVGAIVQRAISHLIADLPYAQVYIDDLQIATHDDMQYHTDCLKEVISRLNKVGLILNNGKAHYAQTQVNALGYTINHEGLSIDPKKVANVHEWPVPTTGKAVQRLLGFSGYLRTLIPLYSRITQPLDDLRNLGSLKNVWNESHDRAFKDLKEALTSTPVISPADFNEEFYVGTDASGHCIGGICYQIINGKVKFVSFASRVLSKSERNYSTTRRELVAVLFCFSKFRHWLLHAKFHLVTDHRCLLYLHTQQTPNNLMLAYYENIFSLDYDVTHTAGIYHILPDRISRIFDIYDDDKEAGDELSNELVKLHSDIRTNKRQKRDKKNKKKPQNKFYLKNKKGGSDLNLDNLRGKNKNDDNKEKVENSDPDINLFFRMAQVDTVEKKLSKVEKENLILQYHVLGHYGINQVEKQMRLDNVSWPNMRKDITTILAHCPECQNFNKITRVGYHPPRSENPQGPGQIWSMDLGDFHLTSASGNNFILIIVDLFSRYVVLRALPNKEAATIAEALVDVIAILGIPRAICSDNDMSNAALTQIFDHLRIDHRLSNPYQPTGNGIAEAYVKQTKLFLMKRFYGCDDQWDKYLSAAAVALNMKYSRLHNTRPFTAQFFRAPNMFSDINQVEPFSSKDINPALIEAKVRQVQDMIIPALRQKIEERQLKDHQYFMKRKRIIYEPYPAGSTVMVEVPTRDAKTIRKYEGPFRVMSVTKGGSYTLASCTSGALLPRPVSVSQIKLISKENVRPEDNVDNQYEVLAVVDHRGDNPEDRKYRVKWKGYPEDSEDTWERIDAFDSIAPIRKYLKRRGLLDNSKVYREKNTIEKYKRNNKKQSNVEKSKSNSTSVKQLSSPEGENRKRTRRSTRRS